MCGSENEGLGNLPAAFRLSRYRFDLEAVDHLRLPAYPGTTFRGGFGHAFKQMVCAQNDWHTCTPCTLGNACPYGYIFEPTLPTASPVFRSIHEVTPPFVIDAGHTGKRQHYPPGASCSFELVLVGRASNYLPYFLLAFQELGRMGIGHPPGRYVLQRIMALHPWQATEELLYDGVDVRVGGRDLSVTAAEVAAGATQLPAHQMTLRFLTPTRIKHQQQFVTAPEFHILIRALLRRVSALTAFHCDAVWETDFRGLITAAEQVETLDLALDWSAQGRYSSRQQQRIDLSGFVGTITYAGQLERFRPLLALGALVHVGKAAVFGNGKYRCV